MTIEEAQKAVDDWIRNIGGGYFSHLTNMALLTEEVGELARVIARTYGEQIGVDLDAALRASLEKKRRRDADRFASRRNSLPDITEKFLLD